MPGFPNVRGRRAPITALALALALLPAGVAHAGGPPVITDVSPMQVEVGQNLTITGRNFRSGADRNIIAFKRARKPAIFVRVPAATATQIIIRIPDKLLPFLLDEKGQSGVRRFRLRVLAKRFGKAFTSAKLSPKVGPPGSAGLSPAPGAAPGAPACTAVVTSATTDTDKDGLSDLLETQIKTDPCKLDTDGDGISDGFEYESALDLNSRALPYPGKKPYPNALDGGDALIDYDGDGLTMLDEYQLWLFTTAGGHFPLTYSDGSQDTGGPTAANGSALDMNGDGVLTDDEKDGDGDGLGNWDEAHGRLTAKWWTSVFSDEGAFFGKTNEGAQQMTELSLTDADTDGDGVLDGQDDQDQDGFTNIQELDRHYAVVAGKNLWVNPYNPCLPDPTSRVCTLHPPLGSPWAPFGAYGGYPPGPYPLTTTKLGPGPLAIPQAY